MTTATEDEHSARPATSRVSRNSECTRECALLIGEREWIVNSCCRPRRRHVEEQIFTAVKASVSACSARSVRVPRWCRLVFLLWVTGVATAMVEVSPTPCRSAAAPRDRSWTGPDGAATMSDGSWTLDSATAVADKGAVTSDMPRTRYRRASDASTSRRVVRFAVIAPKDPTNEQSLQRVLPSVQLAVRKVSDRATGALPGWDIRVDYRDSQCSSTHGPLAAFEFYINRSADAFLGPVCDYVIAPVARYAGVWGIPVLTAGAQADAFIHKPQYYPTLTRMMGSYTLVGHALRHILHVFGWRVAGLLFHNHEMGAAAGQSVCHFTMGAVFSALNSTATPHRSFDENATPRDKYKELLQFVTKTARIVVVCANPLTVREILLAAEELNMVDSGEYVFFNIELFNSMTEDSLQPWHDKNDTDERNARAKKAYSALLTVTAATPNNTIYRAFSDEVKRLARDQYDYEFGNETVSTFVTAFYDAVILYSLALNQTITEGGSEMDGALITKNMWNRTFQGITGPVTIDANGDRIADYSLMDMDKDTFVFRTVANYIGATRTLQEVPNMAIHWAGGRTTPPLDTPVCGFDNSLCPDNTLTGTAILSIVLSSVVVLLAVASVFIFRLTWSNRPRPRPSLILKCLVCCCKLQEEEAERVP